MNKLCYTAFIAFWSCIATLLALQVLVEDETPAAPIEQHQEVEQGGEDGGTGASPAWP